MRKQTKLVAVLSAAALLALGASMTSFAAGWEKDEDGIWHYYDSDVEDDEDDDEDLEVVLRCCTSGSITIPESLRARTLSWMATSGQVRQKQLPTPTESRLYPLSYTMKR